MNPRHLFLSLVISALSFPISFTYGAPAPQRCDPLPFDRVCASYQPSPQNVRLAVEDPFLVRLIYFLPSDRPYRPEVEQEINSLISEAQAFYAAQMELHGFGPRTFAFET